MKERGKHLQLKPFQHATVQEVLKRARRPGAGLRLALADEVGLGKTHVMGEIARRLCGQSGIVMYVAPSLEVAQQNRERLQKALRLRADRGEGSALETRLTLLPAELRSKATRLACLTPNTSFQLRGTGSRRERAFLYAVFRRLRRRLRASRRAGVAGSHFSWERVFYRPTGRAHRDYKWEWQLKRWSEASRSHEAEARAVAGAILRSAADLERLRKTMSEWRDNAPSSLTGRFKRTGKLVSALRDIVAWQVLTGPFRPRVLLLDEWHRYEHLMSKSAKAGQDLLARALQLWSGRRRRSPRATLLVSATPLEVPFGVERVERGGDLGKLCELLDPSGKYFAEVDRARSTFEERWGELVDAFARQDNKKAPVARKRCSAAAEQFSRALFKRILRSERPPAPLHARMHGNENGRGNWPQADFRSLLDARRLFRKYEAGTDILGLWHSSTHHLRMPDAYKLAAKLKGRATGAAAPKKHWKREALKTLLSKRWPRRAPLWISPSEAKRGAGKLLIFSAWRSVPRELTYFFCDESSQWRLPKATTTTPLGAFPLSDRQQRSSEAYSLEKQGWRIFYPPLCAFADDLPSFLNWLRAELARSKPTTLRKTTDWAQVLCALDAAYAEYLKPKRPLAKLAGRAVAARKRLLQVRRGYDWRQSLGGHAGGLKSLRLAMSARAKWQDLPGWQLAMALRSTASLEEALEPDLQHALLSLGRSINNYFNRPVCQGLVRLAERRGKLTYPEAIIRHCVRNEWRETWQEYVQLLAVDGSLLSAVEAMAASLETVATRRAGAGWAGERGGRTATIVQPFVESKVSGPKGPEDEERGALVTTQRRLSFNSPFLPHVLVSTSIGQEGVDFHRYCDTVIHWNPPASPLALEQREGRVDRYRSLQVRIATSMPDAAAGESAGGLAPDFCVVDGVGNRLNKTHSLVLRLPYSREDQLWNRCLERLHYSRLFLGAPDPEALEARLRDRLRALPKASREAALLELSQISVSLSPYFRGRYHHR